VIKKREERTRNTTTENPAERSKGGGDKSDTKERKKETPFPSDSRPGNRTAKKLSRPEGG